MGALEIIVIVLIGLWLLGFLFKIGGTLINLLLFIALAVIVIKILSRAL